MEKENDSDVPVPPFEMGKHHKTALKTLLFAYHSNRQTLTYPELSDRMGVGEKTKAWQCVAWKDLKSEGYIIPASEKSKFELSPEGVALATTLATPEELAEFKPPATNEELHTKIKAKFERLPKGATYAGKILDLMLDEDYIPLNRNDMAAKFKTLADSPGFFYGLQALKKKKYVEFCTSTEIGQIEHFRATKIQSNVKEEDDNRVQQEITGEDVAEEEEEEDSSTTSEGKGKRMATNALQEDSGSKSSGSKKNKPSNKASQSPEKKKYKSTKKRLGGKLLKLAATAYVTPPPCRWK